MTTKREFVWDDRFDVVVELVNEWECTFKISNRDTSGTNYTRLGGIVKYDGSIKFVADDVNACDISLEDSEELSNILNEVYAEAYPLMHEKQSRG